MSLFARRMKATAPPPPSNGDSGGGGGNPAAADGRSSGGSSGEGRGEWLCFDDAHIRVLASWKDAKRFCAKVHSVCMELIRRTRSFLRIVFFYSAQAKYQPTVVWFEKVPAGEAPWWDDEDDADDDDASEDDDNDAQDLALAKALASGSYRDPHSDTAAALLCSDASHLAAVAAAEAELAALDFGDRTPAADRHHLSSAAQDLAAGIPAGAAAAASALQQQVAYAATGLAAGVAAGAVATRDGLKSTLGTPLVDLTRTRNHRDGATLRPAASAASSASSLTPLARAKLRAQEPRGAETHGLRVAGVEQSGGAGAGYGGGGTVASLVLGVLLGVLVAPSHVRPPKRPLTLESFSF